LSHLTVVASLTPLSKGGTRSSLPWHETGATLDLGAAHSKYIRQGRLFARVGNYRIVIYAIIRAGLPKTMLVHRQSRNK
jgi:hypothetical protein